MYGNPTFDCDGAGIRAHCRQLATVVTITGQLRDTNVECAGDHTERFIIPEKPFILDLSGVTSFTREAVSLLFRIDDLCDAAGLEWSLVASRAVEQVLREHDVEFTTSGSVPEALNHFADVMVARRQLLPLLTKTA
ncbi:MULTISPECIES: STAS domain-containing protein [Mycobacteriaceae]|uniref:STAS domain-containing protein n=1 Tax=Mycolicibacterium parafortuitum TaxID=39692 RepID=A0ACC6MH72_MYCPF|nr:MULTISPECIES: STAS domain-containing protein [Mycobacteriaceae]MBX7447697.1 STAS domain-containing protein [Mycolicibacterium aurantiacum]MEC9323354.1 STAS domain-containing protein [Actinomycetota bacterium]MDZ5086326.1 STAS domain-containing protein [Mycolicibacterium parafortuitum]GFM16480.1 anti-sigma-factor antagonist [Mycobacterium sp. PO1]GFM23240.1 anti-sigma-factor antagonist [Mycobacterium sp. PO2]